MFWRRKSTESPVAKLIEAQCLGGQSVLYRLFRESLEVEDEKIHRMELTYFELSLMAGAFLTNASVSNKEEHLDSATTAVIQKSLQSTKNQVDFEAAVAQYQHRYQEYGALIPELFDRAKTPDPAVTLLLHLYECVTNEGAKGKMIQIAGSGDIILQFVVDHVNFVRDRINST